MQTSVGNFKPPPQRGKVGARQRFQAAGVFFALAHDAMTMFPMFLLKSTYRAVAGLK
jgi:hypothetical protein